MEKGIKILTPELFNFGEDWKDYYVELKELKRVMCFMNAHPMEKIMN